MSAWSSAATRITGLSSHQWDRLELWSTIMSSYDFSSSYDPESPRILYRCDFCSHQAVAHPGTRHLCDTCYSTLSSPHRPGYLVRAGTLHGDWTQGFLGGIVWDPEVPAPATRENRFGLVLRSGQKEVVVPCTEPMIVVSTSTPGVVLVLSSRGPLWFHKDALIRAL